MASLLGSLRARFNRTYVCINPDPYSGPHTWRLSNIPTGGEGEDPGSLEGIFAFLPIVETEEDNIVNLSFNIVDLPDVVNLHEEEPDDAYITVFDPSSLKRLPSNRSFFGINQLDAVKPVYTTYYPDVDIATLFFNMFELPDLMDLPAKRRFELTKSTFRYNNRSVDSLTASAPMFAQTVDDTATVTFDVRTLPEA